MHMTMLVVIIEMRAVIVMESAAAGMITRKRANIAINTAMESAVAGIPMRKRANIATNTAMRAAVAVIPTRKRVDTPINTAMKAAAAGIPMTTCIMIRSIPAKYDICPKGWKREHIS